MTQFVITNKSLSNLQATAKPYFLRDNQLKGFGVKVNPSGSIKYVVDVWHRGKSNRKTLGEYPFLDLQEAKLQAQIIIGQIKSGEITFTKSQKSHLGIKYKISRILKFDVSC